MLRDTKFMPGTVTLDKLTKEITVLVQMYFTEYKGCTVFLLKHKKRSLILLWCNSKNDITSLLMSPLKNVEVFSSCHFLSFFKSKLVGNILKTFHFFKKVRDWKVAKLWNQNGKSFELDKVIFNALSEALKLQLTVHFRYN